MDTIVGVAIVSMSPMEFSMKMVAGSHEEILQTAEKMTEKYSFIESIEQIDECSVDVSGLVLITVRVVLEEEADYVQMCVLRSELNTRQYV